MNLIEIILLAVGLAMDCLAVTIAGSIQCAKNCWQKTVRVAFMFGIFQGIMPIIGWLAGISFKSTIQQIDHWMAFVILGIIGGKMILDNLSSKKEDENNHTQNPFDSWKILLLLSIATSIDALAAGFIFIPFGNQIWTASLIIATTSFLFSFLGVFIGTFWGKKFHVNVEIIGGAILIGIGTKILIEHLLAY